MKKLTIILRDYLKTQNFQHQCLQKKQLKKCTRTFVQNKNLQEKYPENMMKAMAYFEVFYNQKLKDEKLAIKDYQENFPRC